MRINWRKTILNGLVRGLICGFIALALFDLYTISIITIIQLSFASWFTAIHWFIVWGLLGVCWEILLS